jgi:hypothetical protein
MSGRATQAVAASLFAGRRDSSKVRSPALAIYPETLLDVLYWESAQAAANLAREQK